MLFRSSFLAFALAVPFIQGALFATMGAGTELARDIQTGFLNRLSLTSLRGSALLFGHLAGVVVLGVGQAIFYIAIGLLVGVEFAAGAGGIVVLLVFAILVSFGFGALGAFLALRTGSGESVQGGLGGALFDPQSPAEMRAAAEACALLDGARIAEHAQQFDATQFDAALRTWASPHIAFANSDGSRPTAS